MPVDETLERVRRELAAGQIAAARQRVRGLVASRPHCLAARELLAETYRRTGDPVQAGRWAYATDAASDAEIAAFARGFRDDPVQMMRALRWAGSADDASSDAVRERLRSLKARAEELTGHEVTWEYPRHPPYEGSWLVGLGGWTLLAFLVIALLVGIVTIVTTLFGWLAG